VTNLQGWTNRGKAMEVWRNVPNRPPGEGSSNIKLDTSGRGNRAEQIVATQAGRTYTLSFRQSPQPGESQNSNSFNVFWNGTRLGTVARSGSGLTTTSWQVTTFTVTGTGSDRISFRENDADSVGALIDDVRLLAN
jgi:hypothetical protein